MTTQTSWETVRAKLGTREPGVQWWDRCRWALPLIIVTPMLVLASLLGTHAIIFPEGAALAMGMASSHATAHPALLATAPQGDAPAGAGDLERVAERHVSVRPGSGLHGEHRAGQRQ